MEMEYKPLGDRVVIEIVKRYDEKTKGGLYKYNLNGKIMILLVGKNMGGRRRTQDFSH